MRRWLNIVAVVIIVALAVGLYKAKTDAAAARAHVRELETRIADAQADMRALRAEIAHLETPARVEALAQRQLGLEVGREAQALPQSAIDERLPAPRPQPQSRTQRNQTKSGTLKPFGPRPAGIPLEPTFEAAPARNGVRFLALALFALLLLLAGRAVQLAFSGDPLAEKGRAVVAASTARADIVDRNGVLLATTVRAYALTAIPQRVWNPRETATALMRVFPDLDRAATERRLGDQDRQLVYLRRGLTPNQREHRSDGEPALGVGRRRTRAEVALGVGGRQRRGARRRALVEAGAEDDA